MTLFLVAAAAATLLAVGLVVVPLYRGSAGGAPLAALLVALLFPTTVVVLYALTSSYPWLAGSGPAQSAEQGSSDPGAVETPEVKALLEQVRAGPRDADAWKRLAEAYVGMERYADARDAYRRVLDLKDGGTDDMRLAFAEAAILADRGALTGEAGKMIDQMLASGPANPRALWYGGMVALSRGDRGLARSRWTQLLALSPPPQVRQIIEQQLGQLESEPLGTAVRGAPTPGAPISVRIQVKPELATRIRPGAALFVIVRASATGGPPLAAVRRQPVDLPMDVHISDADSMIPGRSLADFSELRVTARVANDGEAMPAPGDVYGEAMSRAESRSGGALNVVIDRVVE